MHQKLPLWVIINKHADDLIYLFLLVHKLSWRRVLYLKSVLTEHIRGLIRIGQRMNFVLLLSRINHRFCSNDLPKFLYIQTSLCSKLKTTLFPLLSVQTTSADCATRPQLTTNRANSITRSLVSLQPRHPSRTSPVPPKIRTRPPN